MPWKTRHRVPTNQAVEQRRYKRQERTGAAENKKSRRRKQKSANGNDEQTMSVVEMGLSNQEENILE